MLIDGGEDPTGFHEFHFTCFGYFISILNAYIVKHSELVLFTKNSIITDNPGSKLYERHILQVAIQ